ncbi:predicted protein [Naegleria gruberi]|uniref:Predicted protein n=1 Tax=Naegleria gruberi TaxID=5762 RepID=D2VFV2_NAEGR|nr:uncharacterized protein NAEGRDRAFT_67754 [Naegleria gruberi]EFC44145.1 predicted protein [Naegleria gruberi]|eukprot:XP_002676889.1 predicted protein [Naegleria gruberi strain NEG-M]
MKELLLATIAICLFCCSLVFAQNTVIKYDVSGKNVSKTLIRGEIQYFLVDVSSWGWKEGDFVTLSLNSLSGDCDMWISSVDYPKTACANCLGPNGFGDVRIIYYNSTENAQGVFYVGIIAQERSAEFTFVAWKSNEIININKNEIIFAQSPTGKKNTFLFNIPSEANLITINVDGIYGDPDLYVTGSNGDSWASENYGFETLKIKAVPGLTQLKITIVAVSDTVYSVVIKVNDQSVRLPEGIFSPILSLEAVQNIFVEIKHPSNEEGETKLYVRKGAIPTSSEFDYVISGEGTYTVADATVGDYYFGVVGLMNNTNYKIWAFGENQNQVVLFTSQPVQKAFTATTKSYTFKYANNDQAKTIVATAKLVSGSSINVYGAQFSRPSSTKYHSKAVAITGADGVLKFVAPSPRPNIYFTVAADSGEFSIEVTTSQPIMALSDGEEVYLNWVPKGSYRYFSFVADKYPEKAISITAHPFSGDVGVQVSTILQYPSVNSNQWFAKHTVYIPAQDSKASGKTFYIGVHAFTSDAYFSICASQVRAIMPLSEGTSTSSSVIEREYAYFSLNIKNAGKVNINLNMLKAGDEADIFYSYSVKTPNRYDYEGRSINNGKNVLTIEDANPGEIYISVFGIVSTTDSTTKAIPFTLSIATDYLNLFPNGDTALVNSAKGTITHFRTNITSALRIITASATLISGKTAMYISTNGEKASFTNFVWSDQNTNGNSIVIKQTDLAFRRGVCFIAILAIENSVYRMSLASNIGATVLENIPTLGRTAPDGNMESLIYSFSFNDSSKDVYLHIKELEGKVDVFVNQNNYTSERNYTWKSLSNGEIARGITLKKESLVVEKAVYVSVIGKDQGKSSLFSIEFRYMAPPVSNITFKVQIISPNNPNLQKINPNEDLILTSVIEPLPNEMFSYKWVIPMNDIEITKSYIVIPKHLLTSGISFYITLEITTTNQEKSTTFINVKVNESPKLGEFAVSPKTGYVLETQFNLTANNWYENEPVTYRLYLLRSNNITTNQLSSIASTISSVSTSISHLDTNTKTVILDYFSGTLEKVASNSIQLSDNDFQVCLSSISTMEEQTNSIVQKYTTKVIKIYKLLSDFKLRSLLEDGSPFKISGKVYKSYSKYVKNYSALQDVLYDQTEITMNPLQIPSCIVGVKTYTNELLSSDFKFSQVIEFTLQNANTLQNIDLGVNSNLLSQITFPYNSSAVSRKLTLQTTHCKYQLSTGDFVDDHCTLHSNDDGTLSMRISRTGIFVIGYQETKIEPTQSVHPTQSESSNIPLIIGLSIFFPVTFIVVGIILILVFYLLRRNRNVKSKIKKTFANIRDGQYLEKFEDSKVEMQESTC